MSKDKKCVIRLFGTTAEGNSVCAHIHGFVPYFYVRKPVGWNTTTHITAFINHLKRLLDVKVQSASSSLYGHRPKEFRDSVAAYRIERYQLIYNRRSLVGYTPPPPPLPSSTSVLNASVASDANAAVTGDVFIQIFVSTPETIAALTGILSQPITLSNVLLSVPSSNGGSKSSLIAAGPTTFELFESNVDVCMRFMVDIGIMGSNWIKLPAGKHQERGFDTSISHCQLEVNAEAKDLVPIDCNVIDVDGGIGGSVGVEEKIVDESAVGHSSVNHTKNNTSNNTSIAPLLIASVDIECMTGDNNLSFPHPFIASDRVILIATSVMRHGESLPFYRHIVSSKPIHRHELSANAAESTTTEAVIVNDEKELLLEWKRFIISVDPDILTGYNIFNFDLPFLIDRSIFLFGSDGSGQNGYSHNPFPFFSRIKTDRVNNPNARSKPPLRVTAASSASSSAATTGAGGGLSESEVSTVNLSNKTIRLCGRVVIDMYRLIQRDHKLDSYKLNFVSYYFLKDRKEEISYHSIAALFDGNDISERTRLARYCLKDTVLPLKLIVKLDSIVNLVEMARVTGVSINYLITRAQQYKAFSQIVRYTCIVHPYSNLERVLLFLIFCCLTE